MTDNSSFVMLADICKPVWTQGDPLPDGLTQHEFERMVKAAHDIRRYRDEVFWHYSDYDVGFAGLGYPEGSQNLELVVSRNRKHKPNECENKMCAEHAASIQASQHGIRVIDFSTLIAPRNIDHAAGKVFRPVPHCGPCRDRFWALDREFQENTWMAIGEPYEANSNLPLMAWKFGPLTRALGPYSGGYCFYNNGAHGEEGV